MFGLSFGRVGSSQKSRRWSGDMDRATAILGRSGSLDSIWIGLGLFRDGRAKSVIGRS